MIPRPQRTTGSPVIDAHELGRSYRGEAVLSGITFQVSEGEVFGVLGPDGAGKTTLVQLLAAILDPSEGSCSVLGFDTVREDAAINAQVGYLSQGFTLYDRLTVDENLAFAAQIRGVTEADLRQRSARLLSMAGLADFRTRRAGALSGGMRKKLSLCTTLVHEPPLLLLDELSLGVDPLSRRELWEMLHEFRDEGMTIVITTPYMDEAEHCDRLAFLSHGRLVGLGEPAALRAIAQDTVYEIRSAGTRDAQYDLTRLPGIFNVRETEGTIRFQVPESRGLPDGYTVALGEDAEIHSVAPSLEEAFIHLSGDTADVERQVLEPIHGASETVPHDGPSVEIRDVTCKFGDFVAVDQVSLQVDRGEVFGFVGPNGAGKTTLIRAMCGLLEPSDGELHVAGVDVRRHPRRLAHRIGYMSQRFSLYLDMTSRENLAFFGGVYGLYGQAKRDTIARTSSQLNLDGLLDRKVGDLSGAVRQRLALACSILHRPEVVFLDEPTSGVDPLSRNRFWELINLLSAAGVTVFVTTHYLDEARFCDRLGLMVRGRLLARGTIEDLRQAIGAPAHASVEEIFVRHVRAAVHNPSEAVSA